MQISLPKSRRHRNEGYGDGNADGNGGELWRTLANVGERTMRDAYRARTLANVGERQRTLTSGLENHLGRGERSFASVLEFSAALSQPKLMQTNVRIGTRSACGRLSG